MTRVSGFLSGNDETHDLVRKEMSGVGIWPWLGRKLKSFLGCLLGWLVMVMVILLVAAFVVTKTGLVEIPVISRFYHAPQPTRLVVPASVSLVETLELQIGSRARDLEGGVLPAELTFTLSESDLTRGIQDIAGAGEIGGLVLTDAQVVLSDGKAELFVHFTRGERTTPIRLHLVPALERKPIPLRVRKAYVGEMPVWHRALDALFHQAMKTQLGSLPLADLVTVKNITVREGLLDVTVTISSNLETPPGGQP